MNQSADETRARLAELLHAADDDIPDRPIETGRPIKLAVRAIRVRAFLLVVGAVALAVVLTSTAAVARNRIRHNDGPLPPPPTSAPSSTSAPPSTSSAQPAPVPVMTIARGPDDPTNQTSATFAFTSDPAAVSTECRLDNGDPVPCESGAGFNDLGEGPHRFEVRGINGQGIAGDWAEYPWTIDLTAPTVTISSVVLDYGSGTALDCRLDGQRSDCAQVLSDLSGSHTFVVELPSFDGTDLLTWGFDATPAAVSFAAGPTAPGEAAVIVTFSSIADAVVCMVNENQVPCDQPFTWQEDTSQDTDVKEQIDVTATDLAGNVSDIVSLAWVFSLASIVG
jgi:hypothetical protein